MLGVWAAVGYDHLGRTRCTHAPRRLVAHRSPHESNSGGWTIMSLCCARVVAYHHRVINAKRLYAGSPRQRRRVRVAVSLAAVNAHTRRRLWSPAAALDAPRDETTDAKDAPCGHERPRGGAEDSTARHTTPLGLITCRTFGRRRRFFLTLGGSNVNRTSR